ncbi:(d)CMP kinase [Bacteroides sp. OF04-15BH]|uniref:(d)CMP kinase n=1 Tax=Bacteroides sp. OF04-15BH TaxID=2292281 RepID=UPI000E525370|nr:(d)CMP kinase [Bacteroides sp. OF04-15BH]RHP67010.1 (d)CMP kinase [Bacteroides sp. OF04-15BH]
MNHSTKKIVIAVDGFSSCGKSTMAKDLAKAIGYIYIDSGAMYRAVTLFALRRNLFLADGQVNEEQLRAELPEIRITFVLNQEQRPETYLNGENVEKEIRGLEVSSRVSRIAALDFVRAELVHQQQLMGQEKGIIMDGRDIGTCVFPNAELKIFVTASAEIRAQRRYDELTAKGEKVNFEEILHNVQERDRIDMTRAVSPLRKADDALELDNSHLTPEQQKEWLLKQYNRVIAAL